MFDSVSIPPRSRWLVFSDLDGCLLDHDDYNHAAVDPWLAELDRQRVPLILCSSKTRHEMLALRRELNNHHPFIVENGGAVFLPATSQPDAALRQHAFGRPRAAILQCLKSAALKRYHWRGFAQMSDTEIAALTGLSQQAAAAASWREFCEPLQWLDTEAHWDEFTQLLERDGLRAVRGGRFRHVMDDKADKAIAMRWLSDEYEQRHFCIALGDSGNDRDMLNQADIAVLVRSPSHDYPQARGRLLTIKTQALGPAGWAEAMQQLFQATT